jgi:peptidyl-prolyl cis-trans isomerase D
MLQAIRDKVTGWIAYGIIFLISIPFALWGVNSYFEGGEIAPAATVNGEEIGLRELDRAYSNYRQRLAQLFGGSIPASLGDESTIRSRVLEQLIEESALRHYSEKQNYRIGDEELAQMIRGMDEFRRDGQFDAEIYQAQLRSIGYSPLGFEQQMRRSGSVEQFQKGIRATAFITPAGAQQYASLGNQTRRIRTLKYSVDPASVDIDANQIEQYYLSNTDRFLSPESVKIDFIEVSLDNAKQNIDVNEDDVASRYQENLDAYTSAETREASHILIKVGDDSEAETARTTIDEIRSRIVSGESFSELARQLSEDPGSAADGGNLGEIERGVMVPSFESALFSMQLDELSEPIKTTFGWHLIKLHSISGGDAQSFESVKADLEDEIRTELAEVQIFDLVENLANIVYEQSDSLLPASEQLGLTLQTSDWFNRVSGSGIAAEPKLRQIAFSDEILQQGLNSEAIELGNERVVFIRLNQFKPAQSRPLEEVQQSIRNELRRNAISELGLKAGTEALQSLQAGKTLEDLAQEWSTSVDDHGFVERNQPQIDPEILQTGFSMAKPGQGLVYDGLLLNSGDYAIIELSAVISSNAEPEAETLKTLIQTQGGAEYLSALKYLGSQAEVVRTPLEELY